MEWIKIFNKDDERLAGFVNNKPKLLLIRGRRICVVRTEERWLAVDDTCSHNGESLSKGSVNFLGEIVCPWHGYRFNLKTGRECEQRSGDLESYAIKVDSSGLSIGL